MEDVIEQVSFNDIAAEDIAKFHQQREKILAAVNDRIGRHPDFRTFLKDEEKMRLARECAKIFIENFHATARYRLPAAIIEYLDWLRGFLASRGFPASFLPEMLSAVRTASHAFLEEHSSDDIASALFALQQRERDLMTEEKK